MSRSLYILFALIATITLHHVRMPRQPDRCIVATASHFFDDVVHSEEASWEFEYDTQGWGNSSSEEINAEIHVRAGELQGNVVGPSPRMDSPVFHVVADNLADLVEARHYVVVRPEPAW